MSHRGVISVLVLAAVFAGAGAVAPVTFPSLPVREEPAKVPEARAQAPARLTPAELASSTRAVVVTAEVRREPGAERRKARRERREPEARIAWRTSVSHGRSDAGRLVNGVRLPSEGRHFLTWDPVRWTAPNRPSRLYASDHLIRVLLKVARQHRAAHPDAPRLTVGDLSRRHGGDFGARHGIVGEFAPGRGHDGHVSHQNGLDVDIYYPRLDRREAGPRSLADIDLALAQDLVDRFVAAGAVHVFVGPNTPLTGPPGVVQKLARHDDHMHVRLPAPVR